MLRTLSIITIANASRVNQLKNQVNVIQKNRENAIEHIIVWMGQKPNKLDFDQYHSIPIREFEISTKESKLPLAKARNLGARVAKATHLLFLDVDCIPAPNAIETLVKSFKDNSVICPIPRYLDYVPTEGDFNIDPSRIHQHPGRESIKKYTPEKWTSFWSIGFLISQLDFIKSGGFDDRFIGYGGEDTDFAMTLERNGLELIYVNAHLLHQYHSKFDPPVPHLEDIVANAKRFKEKWGWFPMEKWLKSFKDKGFIDYSEDDINIISVPQSDTFDSYLKTTPF